MTIVVGKSAPNFVAGAVTGEGEIVEKFELSKTLKGKYGLVFFYPLDFTFVCPSELIALDHRVKDFKERNVEVITVSIDSVYTHNAWRNKPANEGGIGQVSFTMVADIDHSICRAYGVEHPELGVAFRGAFIIDKEGLVRAQLVHDLPIGRNIEELLRVVDAIQFHEQYGEVCPANWRKGEKGMQASTSGVADYLSENADKL